MSGLLTTSRLSRYIGNFIVNQCRTATRDVSRRRVIRSACPALLQTHSREYGQPRPVEEPAMFCQQCEQTKFRKGCETVGVCGKNPQVSALQDLLRHLVKGMSVYAHRVTQKGMSPSIEMDDFVHSALFSTLTNVNFDASRFPSYIERAVKYRDELKAIVEELEAEGRKVSIPVYEEEYGQDVAGVRQMIILGLKGMCTYSRHAVRLGERDPWIPRFVYQTFDFLETGPEELRKDLTHNLELAIKVGETNVRVMEILDRAHRIKFGEPSPATISTKPKMGKSILVSGHDIADLAEILEQTSGKDVNVYTHGELMPAHGYPGLRQYKHFAGHFGGAWQLQKFDFAAFPGPIVVTTNCVLEPLRSYQGRLFTMNDCGIPGVEHFDLETQGDIDKVVKVAHEMDGFTHELSGRDVTIGFGREAILRNTDKVLDAMKNGQLSRIFVIGGCDGAEHKRNYFTALADSLPADTLIMTMGCAKYRFNYKDFGSLGSTGLPRLLDLGQCNDTYGAVMVAKALASKLNKDINSLPMSIMLSWFEQKSVAVLLSLLSLGVENIRIGPVMPAFITPTVQKILEEKFKIIPVDIRHPMEDLKIMFQSK
ncbi:hypothetical protein ScPMuIL_006411 [Solemya velum]